MLRLSSRSPKSQMSQTISYDATLRSCGYIFKKYTRGEFSVCQYKSWVMLMKYFHFQYDLTYFCYLILCFELLLWHYIYYNIAGIFVINWINVIKSIGRRLNAFFFDTQKNIPFWNIFQNKGFFFSMCWIYLYEYDAWMWCDFITWWIC